MSARALLRRPLWLPRSSDNTYYVGANALTEQAWDTIFDNLSKHPDLDFGAFGVSDYDTKVYIRERLACLLPDNNYQYSRDQVLVWMSLMTNPLTVSNEDLQNVVAMEELKLFSSYEKAVMPKSRGFFVYTWAMSVFEFGILVEYMKNEEKTVHELVAWHDFIANNPTDQIFIRYIGSCAISEGSIEPMVNIYDETEDARSGILADFYKALLAVLPTVAATCQCYLLKHIATSAEDEEGLHELVHSILIEFFGASFVLNRHPDSNSPRWLTERNVLLADLNLRFDNSVLEQGVRCPATVAARLQNHFKSIKNYVVHTSEVTDISSGVFRFNEAKYAALLGQSMPRFYKRERAIMVVAARDMHINDYMHSRPFSFSRNPDNQLVGQLLSHFKHLDLRSMHAEPFAYYCLAPWPKHESLEMAVVTFGKEMAAFVISKSGYDGPYTTEVFLDEVGQPIQRLIGNHNFFHVPLLDPSRCRYGLDSVDKAARKFMQTSFWNAMLIADKVMKVLDDMDTVEQEIAKLNPPCLQVRRTNEALPAEVLSDEALLDEEDGGSVYQRASDSICSLAMQLFQNTLTTTDVGKALSVEFDEDSLALSEVVKNEPLFMP
ncbi:hypothetical protein F5Y12DRAFT_783407 [Xylaria sp. FL1777]|nr:hypothetical protein F5Y12DRAFT_783407 [Xylaria sp. FL1777]